MNVQQMWWCPTCRQRIPQPRWLNIGKPNQRSYHLLEAISHDIQRVDVLDGEMTNDRPTVAPAPGSVPCNS